MAAATAAAAWAQTFSYDAFGNVSKSGSISWQPNYNNAANQYQSGWNGASYDANGDLLNDTFNTYTWDVYGDLASANGVAITYDAFGRMAENTNGGYQFVYSPAGGKQALAVMHGQLPAYVYVPLPGGAIAVYNNVSQLFQYNHADWLGSARLFSTPARTAISAMSYAPFGEGYAGGQGWVQFTGINGWTVYDTENQSGSLEDFMFRRYSPVQGRWISPDPSGLGAVDPSNPQSWNRYAYVTNTPLDTTDPLGLFTDAVSSREDDTCVLTFSCVVYTDSYGMQVDSQVATQALHNGSAVICQQCLPGQIVGADNGIYSWYKNFYRFDCNGSFSSPACSNTFVGYGLMRTGTVAANNGQQGPDPVAVANSMRQYVKNTLIIGPLQQLVKEGICGGSPSGAVKEGRVGGAIKGGTLGAIEGYAGTGVLAGTTFGGPGGAILGGFIGGTVGSVAGVFSGGITAGACQAFGVYN